MQHVNQLLSQVRTTLPLTSFEYENEAYILTPEEEEAVLLNAANAKKAHAFFKYTSKGLPMKVVEEKFAGTDFMAQIDRDEVLKKANSSKHYKIWQQERRDAEEKAAKEKAETIKQTWTAKMMLKLMRYTSQQTYERTLLENKDTLPLIKTICFFLSNDDRFETELGYSFSKGLLLRGKCGLGKTYLLKCAAANELNPVLIYSMIEIAAAVREDGDFSIPLFTGKLYLDDVGSEVQSNVKHYGNEINWLKDFLETFYLRNTQYNRLILSTNCGAEQIEARYGFRVRSRIKDMFNIIDVTGTDLRGQI